MERIQLAYDGDYNSLVNAIDQGDINSFRNALNSMSEVEKFKLFEQACQKPGRAQFIKACISAGCDVNKINQEHKRPINFVLESHSVENLAALLKGSLVDINAKCFISRQTPISSLARQISDENLQKVFPCMQLLIQHGADVNMPDCSDATPIMNILNNQRLSNAKKEVIVRYFASLNNGQIDGDFIHMFFLLKNRKEDEFLAELAQVEKYPESLQKLFTASLGVETLLIVAVYEDLILALEKMILLGADVNFFVKITLNSRDDRPIEYACFHGHWRSLEILLKSPKLDAKSGPLLRRIVLRDFDYKTANVDFEKCFEILLNYRNIDINQRDEYNDTVLHYAVKLNNSKAVLELLKRGAYIGVRNKFNQIAISNINAKVLEKHFDTCISTNLFGTNDNDFSIKFDFKNLVPSHSTQFKNISNEMRLIEYISKSKELKHLTMHPLIASFLSLKWNRLVFFFCINFFLCALFAVLTVTYILMYYNHQEPNILKDVMRAFMFLLLIYITARELYQFTFSPYIYIKSLENYLECTLIVLVMLILLNFCPENWRRTFAATSILLIAIEIFLLTGSLPFWSFCTHYVMLKRVTWSFLKSLTLYAIILLAFALAFFILLHEPSNVNSKSDDGDFNKFSTIGLSIMKTVVMATGEFDASSINFRKNAFSYILFATFVCIVTIILLNLLNGLAVSDTQAIKSQAELTNFISRAQVLSRYERVLATSYPAFFKIFPFCGGIDKFKDSKTVYHIKVKPNVDNQIIIPGLNNHSEIDTDDGNPVILWCLRHFRCLNRCARMDSKIVQLAYQVLEKNADEQHDKEERQEINRRMTKMETALEKIADKLDEIMRKIH